MKNNDLDIFSDAGNPSEDIFSDAGGYWGEDDLPPVDLTATDDPFVPETPAMKGNDPWYEDLKEGLNASVLSTLQGGKEVLGKLGIGEGVTPEDEKRLEMLQRDAGESGWGTAGDVGGDLLQEYFIFKGLGIPAKAAKYFPKVAKYLPKGIDLFGKTKRGEQAYETLKNTSQLGAPGAILAGVRNPKGEDTRLGNALKAGALNVAGGKFLEKAVPFLGGRFTTYGTPKSRLLSEKYSVYPSAGQASPMSIGGRLEDMGSYLPLTAQWINKNRLQPFLDYQDAAIREIDIPGYAPVTKVGDDFAGAVKVGENMKDAYTTQWAKAKGYSKEAADKFARDILATSKDVTGAEKEILHKIFREIGDLGASTSGARLQAIDRLLAQEIRNAENPVFAEQLRKLKGSFRTGVDPTAAKELAKLDEVYPTYRTFMDAVSDAKKAEAEEGIPLVTPKRLDLASRKGKSSQQIVSGDRPYDELIGLGTSVLNNKYPRIGAPSQGVMDSVKQGTFNSVTPAKDRLGYNLYMGNFPLQDAARAGIDKVANLKYSPAVARELRNLGYQVTDPALKDVEGDYPDIMSILPGF